jgi:hypothetical protein
MGRGLSSHGAGALHPVTCSPAAHEGRRQARQLRRQAERDPSVRAAHRRWRIALWRYVAFGDAWTAVAAPLIYSLLIPLAMLDAWVSLYQAICFRLWGLRRVRRRDYLVIDRHQLAYLNALEKLNCIFCGYANGLLAYVREVAARTEQYWCPIRHRRKVKQPHAHYADFVPYGDPQRYRAGLPSLREDLRR